MARDTLFLLKSDFPDGPGAPYYCPHCAEISGVLSYFPQLKYDLDIRYVDFPRPRKEIVTLIGEANQNCPMLVLSETPPIELMEMMSGEFNGRFFVTGPREIGHYWSHRYATSRPH